MVQQQLLFASLFLLCLLPKGQAQAQAQAQEALRSTPRSAGDLGPLLEQRSDNAEFAPVAEFTPVAETSNFTEDSIGKRFVWPARHLAQQNQSYYSLELLLNYTFDNTINRGDLFVPSDDIVNSGLVRLLNIYMTLLLTGTYQTFLEGENLIYQDLYVDPSAVALILNVNLTFSIKGTYPGGPPSDSAVDSLVYGVFNDSANTASYLQSYVNPAPPTSLFSQ